MAGHVRATTIDNGDAQRGLRDEAMSGPNEKRTVQVRCDLPYAPISLELSLMIAGKETGCSHYGLEHLS